MAPAQSCSWAASTLAHNMIPTKKQERSNQNLISNRSQGWTLPPARFQAPLHLSKRCHQLRITCSIRKPMGALRIKPMQHISIEQVKGFHSWLCYTLIIFSSPTAFVLSSLPTGPFPLSKWSPLNFHVYVNLNAMYLSESGLFHLTW